MLIIKIALSYTFPTCLGLKTNEEPRNDLRTPKLEKSTFLKLAVFFPSLIPYLILPTDDREMKKCLGWHFEYCAREVPTLRIKRNT